MASYQISEKLLVDLVKFHLLDIRTPEIEQAIRDGLQDKWDAIQRRSDYGDQIRNRLHE